MSERKSFALRLPRPMLDALQRWADDELRSLNGQLEYLLRESLRKHGRDLREDREDPPGPKNS